MICQNYQQVYEYYSKVASFYQNRGLKILKTDTHNEAKIWSHSIPLAPILEIGNNVTCIEIDKATLSLAKANFPRLSVINGDIRSLDLGIRYDVILDFSTIDHVMPDQFPNVLYSYRQIADCVGIIVWLSDTRRACGDQYFFNNYYFRKTFYDFFWRAY